MTFKHVIKFAKNWGNKLDADVFTTIRWVDTIYFPGCLYVVMLNGKKYCRARLVSVEYKRISDFTTDEAVRDIGMEEAGGVPTISLLLILKKYYSKKPDWRGEDSVVQKLTLKKEAKA